MANVLEGLDTNTVRLSFFAGIFVIMVLIEAFLPKRDLRLGRGTRWPANLALLVISAVLVRLVFPIGGVGLAVLAAGNGWGILPVFGLNGLAAGLIAFLVLDLAVWFQHWASHKVPVLWRIHRVHHADGDVDVTTALRFHPIEILLSFMFKGAVIVALGGPVEAVLIFEIVLNGAAMFNHANIAMPRWMDGALRLLMVTPDMHRVHHSVRSSETDSNYGFNLSVWDRVFRTYTAQPKDGHLGMKIGLGPEWTERAHSLPFSLWIPFRRAPSPDASPTDQ